MYINVKVIDIKTSVFIYIYKSLKCRSVRTQELPVWEPNVTEVNPNEEFHTPTGSITRVSWSVCVCGGFVCWTHWLPLDRSWFSLILESRSLVSWSSCQQAPVQQVKSRTQSVFGCGCGELLRKEEECSWSLLVLHVSSETVTQYEGTMYTELYEVVPHCRDTYSRSEHASILWVNCHSGRGFFHIITRKIFVVLE